LTVRRLALLMVVAVSLGLALAWYSYQRSAASPVTVAVSSPSGTTCSSVNGLPDPACTPGVADPRVTQDNIHSTICVSGYTTSVRPPSTYTDRLKRQQIQAYGYGDSSPPDYEEDHLIPLELGGSPTDPKNLWPEPRGGDFPASRKDAVENSLHAKVCAGLIMLAAAQVAIARNWELA
jgi:hypothetical protein